MGSLEQALKILMFMVTLPLAKQLFWTQENQPSLLAFLLARLLPLLLPFLCITQARFFSALLAQASF